MTITCYNKGRAQPDTRSEVLPRDRRVEVRFAPKRAAFPWNFGDGVPVLYRQPLVGEWEHHRVHSEKSGGQSITFGERS